MKYRVLGSVALAAAIAFAQPVIYVAQEAGRAAEVLALARKAIGGGKLDTLKTFSVESAVQRNLASMQINSDVEIYLELPDKYARVENTSGGHGMVVAGGGTTGFNGDRPLQKPNAAAPGGGMIIRMGPGGGGPMPGGPPQSGDKPTPEQLEQMSRTMLRSSRTDASRLMLGWFAMAHPASQVTYTYAGEAESVEGKAHVLDVKNADGFAARLFIDERTNLPLMVTYQAAQPRIIRQTMDDGAAPEVQNQPPAMADYSIYFEEWRDAGGVKFPFKMRRAMSGTTTEEWTVSKAKLDPKIDAKKFAVDAGK